jgi:hypothetical protein
MLCLLMVKATCPLLSLQFLQYVRQMIPDNVTGLFGIMSLENAKRMVRKITFEFCWHVLEYA